MRRTAGRLTVAICAIGTGCGEADLPTAATADVAELSPAFSMNGRQILMLDACDPESFNEAFGFAVCTPVSAQAGIPFSTFVALLQQNQRVEAWRFAPDRIRVTRTTTFAVPNKGGIHHSFTEVAEFGGGFVAVLNLLSGNPIPAPECVHPTIPGAPNPDVILVAPGDHDEVVIEPGGGKKYMCCIHPWMRATTM